MKSTVLRKKESGETAWLAGLQLLLSSEGTALHIPDTLVAGWLDTPAVALRTGPTGRLVIQRNIGSNLISSFTAPQPVAHFPLCVMRQGATAILPDTLAVTSLWHKSLVAGRMVFIQRYVAQPGTNSFLVRVVWKPSGVRVIRLTNKVPYLARRLSGQVSLLVKSARLIEERYLTRPEGASMSSQDPDSGLMTQITLCIAQLKTTLDQPRRLSEVTLEFTQDLSLQWTFLRVVSYEIARPIRHNLHFGKRLQRSATAGLKGKMSIKRLSQAILSIKQVMGLEITSGDRKRVSNHTDFSRSVSTAPAKAKRFGALEPNASLPGPEAVGRMPPIFQFPTPKDEDDLPSAAGPNLKEIREHIKRQNNSLFMRIHFQEELPQERMVKDIVRHSVENITQKFDRLRQLGSQERLRLTRKDTDD